MVEAQQRMREVDARGLQCPLPLLKAKQALNSMIAGETVRVLATDVGSQRDFATFARLSGNELLQVDEAEGVFLYVLRKK